MAHCCDIGVLDGIPMFHDFNTQFDASPRIGISATPVAMFTYGLHDWVMFGYGRYF